MKNELLPDAQVRALRHAVSWHTADDMVVRSEKHRCFEEPPYW